MTLEPLHNDLPNNPLYGPLGDAVPVPDDMYERIVQQVAEMCQSLEPLHRTEQPAGPTVATPQQTTPQQTAVNELLPLQVEPPLPPTTFAQLQISESLIAGLLLKSLYLSGSFTGQELADAVRLPLATLTEPLHRLQTERCFELDDTVATGRFSLNEQGRARAREAFERSRYVGPTPVSLAEYTLQCCRQAVSQVECDPVQLSAAMSDLVLSKDLLGALGPALCSGQSLLLYGPSGNGKTALGRRLGRYISGLSPIYVPYALALHDQIVTVFDPTIHREGTPVAGLVPEFDRRWRRVQRPCIVLGADLTLETLTLQQQPASRISTLPAHLKANGGMLLVDDFGRQSLELQELLNRWLLPLEQRLDPLRLPTGQMLSVPVESLLVFATNLDLATFSNAGFLRRFRQKLPLVGPTREQYLQVFRNVCQQRGVASNDEAVSACYAARYNGQCLPKQSDPQDLLETLLSICRFRKERPALTRESLLEAFDRCLGNSLLRATG